MFCELYYNDIHLEDIPFSEIVDFIVVEILKLDKDSKSFENQYTFIYSLLNDALRFDELLYPGNTVTIDMPGNSHIFIVAWV